MQRIQASKGFLVGVIVCGLTAGASSQVGADGPSGMKGLADRAAKTPCYETVSALFPPPGTKRVYLHQPRDFMIVEARPDLKLIMKRALGGAPATGLGFALLNGGADGRPASFDYPRTRQQFEELALPLLKQTIAQAGFVFEQTAFTTADASNRRLVMIRLRVTPESGPAADTLALAWLSVAQPQPSFYSHGNEDYIVFEPWGAAWDAGLDLQLENNVQHDGQTVFAVFWLGKNVSVTQAENARLKKHLVLNLDFSQKKEAVIEVCVPYASGPGTPWPADQAFRLDEATKLAALSFDKEYARQAGQWRVLGERAAAITVPEALVNQIYRTLTLHTHQFLGSAPDKDYYRPGQGGFNTFSTVYGWESSNFLTVMDRQGFHDEIRRVLDYFLTIWLERGERLKALRYFYATLAYSTSRDVHMVHERYCPQLPWLLPWQPNASGSGRVLEMILNTLLFEKGDKLCLLYGVPDSWFDAGKPIGVSGLSLTSGRFSFSVRPQPQTGRYAFSYECKNRIPAKFLLALPSGSGREARRIVEIESQNRKSATHMIPAQP